MIVPDPWTRKPSRLRGAMCEDLCISAIGGHLLKGTRTKGA